MKLINLRTKSSPALVEGTIEETTRGTELLKVGSNSNPASVAGAIAGFLRENDSKALYIQAIGAGAVNQSVKAIAIARGYLAPNGIDLVCSPFFINANIDGDDKSAINIKVIPVL